MRTGDCFDVARELLSTVRSGGARARRACATAIVASCLGVWYIIWRQNVLPESALSSDSIKEPHAHLSGFLEIERAIDVAALASIAPALLALSVSSPPAAQHH